VKETGETMKICFQYAGQGGIGATPSEPPPPPSERAETREAPDALARSTRRAKLVRLVALAALATFGVVGCGESDAPAPARTAAPDDSVAPTAPEAPAKRRTLVTGNALPTSPVNLIADPGFYLLGYEQGFGSFITFYNDGDFAEVTSSADSRSPAGFGGRVANLKDAFATDAKSRAMTMLASFAGGPGPFRAQVWVSKSDSKGTAVAAPTDKAAIQISIAGGAPGASQAYDLAVDPAATRTVGDRTWLLYRADIGEPITPGGFFMVEAGEGGGQWHIAAPELVATPLLAGQPTRALSNRWQARARALSRPERDAARRYAAIPPRLVPAANAPGALQAR
jgi:hypothetical protein